MTFPIHALQLLHEREVLLVRLEIGYEGNVQLGARLGGTSRGHLSLYLADRVLG